MSSEVETSLLFSRIIFAKDKLKSYSLAASIVRDSSTTLGMTKKAIEVTRPSFQLCKQSRLTVPFLGESTRTLFPLFHDKFIQRRIDGQGIIPVKTSEAKRIGGPTGGLDHSFNVEIAETIDIEILADFFHRHLVSDQLFRIGKIDPVMAGETMRRTTHSQMHLFRACFSQVDDARSRGGPTHNRIVHHYDSFPFHHFLDQI